MYQHTRLTTNRFTFFQKFRNFDYVLLFCILLLGFISLATMYSTDGGEVLFHTRSHFTKFIVFKSGSIEPEMAWVEIGISDLSRVEIKEGLNKGDSVFVLPSKGLVDRQERFRQRVKSWG